MGVGTIRRLSQIGAGAGAQPGGAHRLRAAGELRDGDPARAFLHPLGDPGAGRAAGGAGVAGMRTSARLTDPGWPALSPVALSAACLAPVLWGMAGLALTLAFLVPVALAGAVLAPAAWAYRFGGSPPWSWLCGHYGCPWLWSWVLRSWIRWPRLCRHWLRSADECSNPRRPRVGHDRPPRGSDTQ